MKKTNKKGFTLIELLVVIAIIGLLAAMVGASVSSARAKGRDSRRMADLKSVQTAIEMYNSQNGIYPPSGITYGTITNPRWGDSTTYPTNWVKNLVPDFMSVLPVDPINRNTDPIMRYYYASDKSCYKLMSRGMESAEGLKAAANDGSANTARLTDYELFTAGCEAW